MSVPIAKKEVDEEQYPRILIISPNPLNPVYGGGVLLANLFQGWPAEKIADIYSVATISPEYSVCQQYYKLYPRIQKQPREWFRRSIDYIRGKNESLDGYVSSRITPQLRSWLDEYRPQLVYSHLGSLSMTRLTNRIAQIYKIPLVVHIMDDYIVNWPVNGVSARNIFPVAPLLHFWNRKAFQSSLQMASLRYCISEQMSAEYAQRYGGGFHALRNGIDAARWGDISAPKEAGPTFRMLYAGSIQPSTNLQSMRELADAVWALNQQRMSVQLDIACPHQGMQYRAELERTECVRFVAPVPHDAIPNLLVSYDLLVLPFNFDKTSIRFIQYSWPTKVAESMASAVPILLYSSAETAFVQDALAKNWAFVVSQPGVENLTSGLRKLISDRTLRQTLGTNARRIAFAEHDLRKIREEFHNTLRSLVFPNPIV